MFKGVIIAEGCSDGVKTFDTMEKLLAYGEGLTRGANLYGAGGCGLYTLDDLSENGGDIDTDDDRHEIIKRALNNE